MCLVVYVGATKKLPLIAVDNEAASLCVAELWPGEHSVKEKKPDFTW